MDHAANSSIPSDIAKACIRKAKSVFCDKDEKIKKFTLLYAGMQALLAQADSMKPNDEGVKFWIKAIRDLFQESGEAFNEYNRRTERCSKDGNFMTRKVVIFYAKLKLSNKYMEVYERHKYAQEVLKSLGFEYLGNETSIKKLWSKLFRICYVAAAGVGVGAGAIGAVGVILILL